MQREIWDVTSISVHRGTIGTWTDWIYSVGFVRVPSGCLKKICFLLVWEDLSKCTTTLGIQFHSPLLYPLPFVSGFVGVSEYSQFDQWSSHLSAAFHKLWRFLVPDDASAGRQKWQLWESPLEYRCIVCVCVCVTWVRSYRRQGGSSSDCDELASCCSRCQSVAEFSFAALMHMFIVQSVFQKCSWTQQQQLPRPLQLALSIFTEMLSLETNHVLYVRTVSGCEWHINQHTLCFLVLPCFSSSPERA